MSILDFWFTWGKRFAEARADFNGQNNGTFVVLMLKKRVKMPRARPMWF